MRFGRLGAGLTNNEVMCLAFRRLFGLILHPARTLSIFTLDPRGTRARAATCECALRQDMAKILSTLRMFVAASIDTRAHGTTLKQRSTPLPIYLLS